MGNTDVLKFEQERVDAAYSIAEQALEVRSRPTQAANQKDAQAIHRGRQAKLEQLRQLLEDSDRLLVRGRVDFAPGDSAAKDLAGETYYVGMAHLAALADQEPVVVSWEAPLARAFREPTLYNGGGAVARTRTFDGHDRRLTEVRETRFVEGQPEPGSGDPLLEALERRSGGQLHDVVATIQAEQFALMERPVDATLVVQGGPGTGKTIIGLHRLSVLLYRSEGDITEGDVLVVGPSEVFMRYIERVLPELGRGAVLQTSVDGIAHHEVRAKWHDRPAVREIKGRAVMADVMRRYLDARIGWKEDHSLTIGRVTVPKKELKRISDAVRASTAPYNSRRQDLSGRLLDALGGVRQGKGTRGARGRGLAIARSEREQFERALNRLMPTRSPREVVHELTSGRILLARASDGLLSSEEREAILSPAGPLKERRWTLDDLPLLDEAAAQLDGVQSVGKRYLHIVVDEAQDLSPMQLRMLKRRLSGNGAMTVLGDLAQGSSPWAPASWQEHLGSGGIEVAEVAQIRHSYRTTAPLLDYANRLLASIDVDVEPAASVILDGDEPTVVRVERPGDMDRQLLELVQHVLPMNAEGGSVAVIADPAVLRRVSEAFDDGGVPHTWAARSLDEPVTLVPAASASGLEFDHVFVVEPDVLYRTDPVVGPRLLYVALTRARETLTLLHHGRLPTVLAGVTPPATQVVAPTIEPPASDAPEVAAATAAAPPPPSETPASVPAPPAPVEPPAAPMPTASDGPSADVAPEPSRGPMGRAQERPKDPTESAGWSWFIPDSKGQGLLHVTLSGSAARVERVPSTGGEGVPIATGYAISDAQSTHWLLQRVDGTVLTMRTSRDAGLASRDVVSSLGGEPGPDG